MGASLRGGRRGSTAAWRWDSTAAQSAWQDGSTVVARAAGQHCSWRYVLWPYLCGGNGATWQISGGATWQRGRMAVLQRSSRAGSGAARQRGGGAARQHSSTVLRIDDAAHQHVSLGTGQHASMGRSRAAWQRGSWATGQPGSMQSNRAAQQRGSTEACSRTPPPPSSHLLPPRGTIPGNYHQRTPSIGIRSQQLFKLCVSCLTPLCLGQGVL